MLKQILKSWQFWIFITGFLCMGIGVQMGRELEKNLSFESKVAYAFRYIKMSADSSAIFVTNSTDEGYWYTSHKQAEESGYSAMNSDREIGYIILSDFPVVFRCLKNE